MIDARWNLPPASLHQRAAQHPSRIFFVSALCRISLKVITPILKSQHANEANIIPFTLHKEGSFLCPMISVVYATRVI
jgi:hypothetical protein